MTNAWFFSVLKDQKLAYKILCTGILYSLFIWPLLNAVLCILLAGYWLLFYKKTFDRKSASWWLALLFLGMFLPYLAGIFYSTNLSEAWFRLREHLPLLMFPLVFGYATVLDKSFCRYLMTQVIFSTLLTALLGIVFSQISLQNIYADFFTESTSMIFGSNYPYVICLSCLLSIIILGEGLYNNQQLSLKWVILIFIFLSLYLLMINVRLTSFIWLGYIIYFIYRKIRNPVIKLSLSILMIIIFGLGIARIPALKSKWNEIINYRQETIQLDQDSSLGRSWGGLSIRIALWKCGTDLIARHRWIGVGTGDIQDSLQQAYENRKFYFASRYNSYDLHNQYLQTLGASGIFGLFFLVACIIIPFFSWRTAYFYKSYVLFLAIFSLICLTEAILDTNKGIIWYSFFNSIFAFGGRKLDDASIS